MNTFRIKALFNSFKKSFLIIFVCLLAPYLIFLGLSVGAALLATIIIPLAIFFGYIRELAGSLIFMFLHKLLETEILKIIKIWLNSPQLEQSIQYLNNLNEVKTFLLIFFIVFSINFLTKSIKIFNIDNSSEAKNEIKSPNQDKENYF